MARALRPLRAYVPPRRLLPGLQLAAGIRSAIAYWKLAALTRRPPHPREPVTLALRPLSGRSVLVRPGTSDVLVLFETFIGGFHTVPEELSEPVRLILDLGANIGLTVADFVERFPAAKILGVELDHDNAVLAGRNTAAYGPRCEIVHAAVWPTNEELAYGRDSGREYAFRVDPQRTGGDSVRGVTISELIDRLAPEGQGDRLRGDGH